MIARTPVLALGIALGASVSVLTGPAILAAQDSPGEAGLPEYLKDRGTGLPTTLFGTYIRGGDWIVYPFFEYYRDADREYKPSELGYVGELDYRGRYRASEGLLYLGYGLTDDFAAELEVAVIDATLEKSADDPSALPAKLEASGLGDVDAHLLWRWRRENERRPELFSFLKVAFPRRGADPLIGTPDWEFGLGMGVTRGFDWGTMTVRAAIEFAAGSTSEFDVGEYAVEYLRRVSRKWRLYAAVEGTQDEVSLITEVQWHLSPNVVLKLNNGLGLTSKATDWEPEVGILFRLPTRAVDRSGRGRHACVVLLGVPFAVRKASGEVRMGDLNGVMMQFFHWCDVGYGVYDMYDLGEFEQKGTVRTKYGAKAEYLSAVAALQGAGLQVYADVVLNHRMGGDATDLTWATPYPQDDRLRPKGERRETKPYTHFSFPGRRGRHSTFEWHARHFDAVDYDDLHPDERNTVYLIEGKAFDDQVALERGNYSYLMGCDLDFQSEEVRNEITAWGRWTLDATRVDGFRLDAVKHISAWFFPEWLDAMERHCGKNLFVVGEYWTPDAATLHWYLDRLERRASVFGVPLHYQFHYASRAGGHFDMRRLFEDMLVQSRSTEIVTFVDNHDSQPLQALESAVEPWFKPLAYATILLRREGYPCLFYPDYYGAKYEDWGRDGQRHRVTLPSHRWLIDKFLHARKHYAHGPQYDYFDHWNRVGWTRLGDEAHPKAMAVLLSDAQEGTKWMEVGKPHARFTDLTEHVKEPVTANEHGWGEFRCNSGSVSVWVQD